MISVFLKIDRLREIAILGEPIFQSHDLTAAIEALSSGLKLLSSSVQVYNNSKVLQKVLGEKIDFSTPATIYVTFFAEDNLHIREIFMDPTKMSSFLTNKGGMVPGEASDFLNATLKIAKIFLSINSLELKPITCNPERLATFLITDNDEAIKALSEKLCRMNSTQIETLVRLVQQNLDIEGLLHQGLEAANRTLSYDLMALTDDLGSFSNTFWSLPALQGVDPPPISQVDLWSEDFGLMLTSIFNSNDINFKVYDVERIVAKCHVTSSSF